MVEQSAQQIAKESKSSFYYAFNLLPASKREAMNTVYAFCRKTDDIVDENDDPADKKLQNLVKWRREFESAFDGSSSMPLLNKVAGTIAQFKIPTGPFFELIKGMEMDLVKNRYDSFEELRLYCYRVASCVGLMCIEIFGYRNQSAKAFANNLGLALQLTNILRDVGRDAKDNRIYLPREDMQRFNYTEEELLAGEYNEKFVNLMAFEAGRAIAYFDKATAYLSLEDKGSMFAARAMQHIYRRVLDKIIARKYNVFNNKISISKFEKAGIALGVWAKYRLIYR